DSGEVHDGILLRHLDTLPRARRLPLNDCSENADREVEPGAGVAEPGLDADRRSVGEAGEAHGTAHGLGDHLEALVAGVGADTPESLDRGDDDARVDLREGLVT